MADPRPQPNPPVNTQVPTRGVVVSHAAAAPNKHRRGRRLRSWGGRGIAVIHQRGSLHTRGHGWGNLERSALLKPPPPTLDTPADQLRRRFSAASTAPRQRSDSIAYGSGSFQRKTITLPKASKTIGSIIRCNSRLCMSQPCVMRSLARWPSCCTTPDIAICFLEFAPKTAASPWHTTRVKRPRQPQQLKIVVVDPRPSPSDAADFIWPCPGTNLALLYACPSLRPVENHRSRVHRRPTDGFPRLRTPC